MQSAFAKSCIFRRTQSKSPHFLHVQKMLPARIVYLHSCPSDGRDLFHEICIFSGRWGNAIIHPSTTGKPLSNQCCVYSPCFFARIPLFLFSEMKTHGGGCAIVRPGCRVFFFCPQIFFTDSCIFASNFVHFLFLLLTFSDRFATIIPIYRGTNACPSEGIELRRLKPDPLNLLANTNAGSWRIQIRIFWTFSVLGMSFFNWIRYDMCLRGNWTSWKR